MWINKALSGGATKLDDDEFGALECAGLLMVSPVGSPIAGWIQHNLVAALSGMPSSNWSGSRECTCPSSPEHVLAHQFSAFIQECMVSPNSFHVEDLESEPFGLEDDSERNALRIAARTFVDNWKQLIASVHPIRGATLLRHPLPITVRDERTRIQIQQTVVANRQRSTRDRQAAEMVNTVQKLTMFDSGSPENGPVMWTIAYALLELPSGSSMRLTELVNRVTAYLGSSRNGYVARIAQESIFRKVLSSDDVPAIELDYSGRGEPGPFSMYSNLSCSPSMYRLADSWIYEASEFAKPNGEVQISLPLAVHLAILARTISDEDYDSGVPAVVVMGERRGWLYLKPDTLEALSARGKLCIQIHDQGKVLVRNIVGLEELIPNFADLSRRPTEMLRALGALLGMRILEDSDEFPLPRTIRIWVKARGQTATSFDQELLEAALVAQRQLEGQVDGHE